MLAQTLFITVVDRGQAESILQKTQAFSVGGGVVMPGEGTISNKWLEILGLNESQKDVIFLPILSSLEDPLHELMLKEFKIHKRRRGISFSLPLSHFQRLRFTQDQMRLDPARYKYHCIISILEQGKAKDCVEHAKNAGAPGGTILHGRGAGVPQDRFFNLLIEPKKEIVFFVVPTEIVDRVQEEIVIKMQLEEEGQGIIFALPVTRATGLFETDAKVGASQ